MSIIIDLLKNSLSHKTPDYVGIPPIPLTQNQSSSWLLDNKHLILIAILLVILVSMVFSKIAKISPIPAPHPLASPVETRQPVIVNEPFDLAKINLSATINDITISQHDSYAELTLKFNHPVLYRITSHQNENTFTLAFDNTQVAKTITINDAHQAGIEDINAKFVDESLLFNLTLTKDAVLESIQPIESKNDYQLAIHIKKNKPIATPKPSNTPIISTITKTTQDNSHNDQYLAAIREAKAGNTTLAIKMLNELVQQNTDFVDAEVALAALLLNEKNFVAANKVLNQALTTHPKQIALIELKARLYLQHGKSERAMALLDQINPAIETNPSFYALKAAIYEKEENHQVAAALYRRLLQQDELNGQWWFGLAVSLDKSGDFKQAVYAYQQALKNGHLAMESLAFLQDRLNDLREYRYAAS